MSKEKEKDLRTGLELVNQMHQEAIDSVCDEIHGIYKTLHEVIDFDEALRWEYRIEQFFKYVDHYEKEDPLEVYNKCRKNITHLKNLVKAHKMLKVSDEGFSQHYG